MQRANTSSLFKKTLGWAAAGVGVLLVANAVIKEIKKFKFEGKVVLITGGSRGLGFALARQLAAKGAKLAICARSADKVELARQELALLGAEVIAMPVDVTDRSQMSAMINEVVNRFGGLDVLINNAGIVPLGPKDNMGDEEYGKAMETNFWAPLYAIHSALPYFRQQREGRIVNITSIAKMNVHDKLPFHAGKFAAIGISNGMSEELKKLNIHVTNVAPDIFGVTPSDIQTKGYRESENIYFESSPLLAAQIEQAAKEIIKGIEYGESDSILSLSGNLSGVVKNIAPVWVTALLVVADKIFPAASVSNETRRSIALKNNPHHQVALLTDKSSIKNN